MSDEFFAQPEKRRISADRFVEGPPDANSVAAFAPCLDTTRI